MNQQQLEEHPEIGTFFERMAFLPLTKVTKMVPPGGAGIGMHVIPVERAIEYENEAADVERISHWLKKYDRFSVGACSCRAAERVRGGNAGSDPQNWCIGLGDMADYCVETGKGHYATYDEVMDILILAERNGYVHQITNIDGSDKIFAICNCDVNVCYARRTSQLFNTPNMSRSAYVAQVDGEKCVACAGCVEVCPAGAVKLGRSSLPKMAQFLIRNSRYPRFSGARKIGTPITRIRAASSAMRLARLRVRWPVLRIFRCRDICAWRLKGVIAMRSRSSSRRIPSQRYADASATKRCEAACTRGTIDEPVAIDDVKRFIAEKDLEAEYRYVPEVILPPRAADSLRRSLSWARGRQVLRVRTILPLWGTRLPYSSAKKSLVA